LNKTTSGKALKISLNKKKIKLMSKFGENMPELIEYRQLDGYNACLKMLT